MELVTPRYEYVWQVDPALAAAAQRFVDGFNDLFGPELPPPTAKYARIFWHGFDGAEVVGRCVRLGQTDPPARYYHWGSLPGSRGPTCRARVLARRDLHDRTLSVTCCAAARFRASLIKAIR